MIPIVSKIEWMLVKFVCPILFQHAKKDYKTMLKIYPMKIFCKVEKIDKITRIIRYLGN